MTKKKRNKEKTSAKANNKNQSRGFGTRRVEKEFTGFTYHKMSSPFQGMAEDEIVESILKLGEKFGQQFDTSFETLQQQILQVDPCSLL